VTARWAASADTVAHVFVDEVTGDGELVVDGADGHHLQRVRRLRVGEAVTASDGRGRWRLTRVTVADGGTLTLAPESAVTEEPALDPSLTVAFAPAKGDQAGAVVHQLVELGVDRVMPVVFARSVVRWEGEREGKALERLRRVVREAAMQSRRARLPELVAPQPLDAVVAHPGLVVADAGGVAVSELAPPTRGEWLLLVGPEGGFDPVERARTAAAARLAVGPHVLRAVTAPVAAAAALAGLRRPATTDSPGSGGPEH
jgi:16S rRNA (uracil1498-N3)-methyltransferase